MRAGCKTLFYSKAYFRLLKIERKIGKYNTHTHTEFRRKLSKRLLCQKIRLSVNRSLARPRSRRSVIYVHSKSLTVKTIRNNRSNLLIQSEGIYERN